MGVADLRLLDVSRCRRIGMSGNEIGLSEFLYLNKAVFVQLC
jgi:hypothetical protein